MLIKLRDNKVFRTTVGKYDVRVGGTPTEVTDEVGKYLLESFPDILEKVKEAD